MLFLLLLATLQVAPITPAEVAAGVALAPAARDQFDEKLLDYPTARFRDVHVSVNTSVAGHRGSYFCGYVNSKNRMGAFVGWHRFGASGSTLIIEGDNDIMDDVLESMCGPNASMDEADRSALLAHRD